MTIKVGMFSPPGLLEQGQDGARAFLAQAEREGINHVCCGDHVSFFIGLGFDGLLQATALTMLHPTLPVSTGVYLLPLRHPVLVARQLADIGQIAPGRLTFGVGIGGEDRHEVSSCGIDPATRGPRMDECLAIVRELLTGKPVTYHGTFFDLDEVVIAPAPAEAIPIVVGGRSDAAIRRAGRLGDGWLGIWNSPRRFAAAVELAAEEAARAGPTRHSGTRCRSGAASLTPKRPPAPASHPRWRPSTSFRSSASRSIAHTARPTTWPSSWHRTPPRAARHSTSSRNHLTRNEPSPTWQQ